MDICEGFFYARVAEWPNALVCKTNQPRVRIPPRVLMSEHMKTPFNEFKSVEATKAASLLVRKNFPDLSLPIQGELQTITRLTWERGGKEDQVVLASTWWLWFRTLFIENTMQKDAKRKIQIFACEAATSGNPLTIVTTRSPELVHAQIGMADSNMPRSKQSLKRLQELVETSNKFIPTAGKVLLADLAIDNVQKIRQVCDIDTVMDENHRQLLKIASEIGLCCTVGRLSQIVSNETTPIPVRSWGLIKRVMSESLESHTGRFGWSKEQSETHNLELAMVMGRVGSAIHSMPRHILLHNEAFISRGALNNLFNPPHDPLPVVCLTDLLEKRAHKI